MTIASKATNSANVENSQGIFLKQCVVVGRLADRTFLWEDKGIPQLCVDIGPGQEATVEHFYAASKEMFQRVGLTLVDPLAELGNPAVEDREALLFFYNRGQIIITARASQQHQVALEKMAEFLKACRDPQFHRDAPAALREIFVTVNNERVRRACGMAAQPRPEV
jgi:hypothetical protein